MSSYSLRIITKKFIVLAAFVLFSMSRYVSCQCDGDISVCVAMKFPNCVDNLVINNDLTVKGTLFVDEIDPRASNPSHTTCFSGNVAVSPEQILLANDINPVVVDAHGYCIAHDNGTTILSGNVIADKTFKVTGTSEFVGDVTMCDGTLFVNEIDPCSPRTTTTFSGSISLPSTTTANNGSLQIDGVRFLHNFGTANTFVGANAGNLTMSGIANVAIGTDNLAANTSGSFNTASGVHSLCNNTTGSFNTGAGLLSLEKNTVGIANTALGFQTLNSNITGSNNTAIGASSLASFRIGDSGFHTGVGGMALNYLITGTGNTALGNDAGAALLIGSNNIYIANRGVAQESNVIRLGTALTHTGCFIPTIANTPFPSGSVVIIDPGTGELGVGAGGSNTIFAGDVSICDGTLFVSKIDPCSPTTTTTFSGSISLPNTTTANNGSLQMNGIRFLHDFGTDNLFAGANAGNFTMTGTINVGVGTESLSANTTGSANSALGAYSLQNNTIGANNCALGAFALQNNDSGFFNTALGSEALRKNTIAIGNTALGAFALKNNTTGPGNTAMGVFSLANNTTGPANCALGTLALQDNTEGGLNCAVGPFALLFNKTGESNTAVGAGALLSNVTGSENTAVGTGCLQDTITGNFNIAIGNGAGRALTAGNNNIYIGNQGVGQEDNVIRLGTALTHTGCFITTIANTSLPSGSVVVIDQGTGELGIGAGGSNVTFAGDVSVCDGTLFVNEIDPCSPTTTTSFGGSISLPSSTSANNGSLHIDGVRFLHNFGAANTFVGNEAGNLNLSGGNNTAVGQSSLKNNATGGLNTALGSDCLVNNTIGNSNTALGVSSLMSNIDGHGNTALGTNSLPANSSGGSNTAVGSNSMGGMETGFNNCSFGPLSLFTNASGTDNIAIGVKNLFQSIGSNNTAIGRDGFVNLGIGSDNIGLGMNAGAALTTGNNNIYIGNQGVGQEDNVIRLGTALTHTGCFIPTIANAPLPAGSIVIIDPGTGELGVGDVGSNVTFDGDLTMRGGTLFVSEIDACSPTTTTSFSSSISLPSSTTANNGSLQINGSPFLHNYGSANTFAGASAGNLKMSGANNTGVGAGNFASNTTGASNTAVGRFSMFNNTTGSNNAALGTTSLFANKVSSGNTAIGVSSLGAFRIGDTGKHAALGINTLANLITGTANTAIGAISNGAAAGSSLIAGSDNIYIANRGVGQESEVIRLGTTTTHTGCFIAGINGAMINLFSAIPVLIDSSGHLGTLTSSERYKDDIVDIGDKSGRLMELRPVTFVYKADGAKTLQYGLIAEEVKTAYPELVAYGKDGLPESVMYHQLPVLLLNEYQQQQNKLVAHAQQLEMLNAQEVVNSKQFDAVLERIAHLEQKDQRKMIEEIVTQLLDERL